MAEVYNRTRGVAELVPSIDKDGRNVGVVILKLTYQLKGAVFEIAEQQEALQLVDEYLGEPGKSEIRLPADLADRKPGTDILLIPPQLGPGFQQLSGRNFAVEVGALRVAGEVATPWRFGPLGRDDKTRLRYAGTYDQAWIENRMPLLPIDFDPRYHQVAPPKQVIAGYLQGDERFSITNLAGDGRTINTALPGRTCVLSGNVLTRYFTEVPPLDTVLIFLDTLRITLVWRHAIRVRQKVEEISTVNIYMTSIRVSRELYGKPPKALSP